MQRLICWAIAALIATPALAAEPPGTQVTTYEQGGARIQEYRLRGQLYRVTVIPRHGKPYDLVRADGSGDNFIRSDQPSFQIPQWTLLKW